MERTYTNVGVTGWIEGAMEHIDRLEMDDEPEDRASSRMRSLTLKCPPEVHADLDSLAARLVVSKTSVAQDLLKAALADAMDTLEEKQYFNDRIAKEGVLVS